MDNVSINFDLSLVAQGDNSSVQGLGSAIDKISEARGVQFADGTGLEQCDVFFHDILSITTADEVDLNGVVLKDAFGVGLAIAKLKVLYIKNLTGVDLTIGVASEPMDIFGDPTTDDLVLPDDGELFMTFPGDGLDLATSNGMLEFVHAVGSPADVELICAGVR